MVDIQKQQKFTFWNKTLFRSIILCFYVDYKAQIVWKQLLVTAILVDVIEPTFILKNGKRTLDSYH